MTFTAFCACMLVCIYLAIVAQNMKDGAIVWGCSVSLFAILILKIAVEVVKRMIA